MKRVAILVTVVGVIFLGGYYAQKTSTVTVVNNEPQVIEKEVEVDALEEAIKTRQNAVSEATEAIGKKAYDDAVEQENKKIELQVIKEFNEKLNARQIELEKETNQFWTRERIVSLIRQTFPEDAERALAIAKCESGFNPKALNNKNKNGSSDGGIFQINSTHDTRLDSLGLDKMDVEDNVTFARMLYEESKWTPWVCHSHGLAYR